MKRKKDKIYMVISIGTKLKKNSVPIHGKTKQNKTKKSSQQNKYRKSQLRHNKEHIENPQLTS